MAQQKLIKHSKRQRTGAVTTSIRTLLPSVLLLTILCFDPQNSISIRSISSNSYLCATAFVQPSSFTWIGITDSNHRTVGRSLFVSKLNNPQEDLHKQQQQQQDDDEKGSGEYDPLFDITTIETNQDSSTTFRVNDMSLSQPTKEQQNNNEEGVVYDLYNNNFYDKEEEDDNDDLYSKPPQSSSSTTTTTNENWLRDNDDLLTEREDRLYVDEHGRRRKVETCILVGVEDAKTRQQRKRFSSSSSSSYNSNDNDNENSLVTYTHPEEEALYFSLTESLTEMRELIATSGMEVVGEIVQRMNEVNPRTYVGTGKLKDVQALLERMDCCTVVFDAELTPGQQKTLENALNKEIIQNDFMGAEQIGEIKVVDRTALILDIFAQHAKTLEGKLQVDLALHVYRKPRLTKMWTHLERQSGSGGVGLRGPGESQLEIDKRLVRDRIHTLQKKIESVKDRRSIHRKGRSKLGLPTLAFVGYTNSGKSTLLNTLTRAGVMAEDILFATLDPTTRRVKLPGLKTHPEVLVTDTVGFVQKLPTALIAAFRATLEEVKEADVLVHVMDVSSYDYNNNHHHHSDEESNDDEEEHIGGVWKKTRKGRNGRTFRNRSRQQTHYTSV